jgi:rRNA biogenesis protein RRP5
MQNLGRMHPRRRDHIQAYLNPGPLCREQRERFNVWLAYLVLENTYGEDPEQAAAQLLQRALQHNDAKKMYLAAVDVFEKTNRLVLLETCLKGLRRKFGTSCKVWLRIYRLELSKGGNTAAVLDRAVAALPTRKHVKLLSRVALTEFREASPERARAIFENVLQTYPKRTDLWGVYIDQEIRAGDAASIRNLFERAIHLNLAWKKMKFFFKRYVAYETEHGTPERVEYVKQRAMDFIGGGEAVQQ